MFLILISVVAKIKATAVNEMPSVFWEILIFCTVPFQNLCVGYGFVLNCVQNKCICVYRHTYINIVSILSCMTDYI